MAIRKSEIKDSGYYFITFTCYKWLPLFEISKTHDLIYKWFDYLQTINIKIVGYVIMPNHIHLLIAYKFSGKRLNTIIGNSKRFLAYGIVDRLRTSEKEQLLHILRQGVSASDKKRNKVHEVFENSFEVKECSSRKFLSQKLGYIHNNPCSKKWMLAKDIVSYPHSSARYYETGMQGVYFVTSWMELEEDNWWG